VIFFDGSNDRVQRLRNIQNQLHALDPQTYPRTAVIAYAIDPRELETAIDEAARSGAKLKAFYHSHPDHDAYFSEEDKAFACPFGEPTFPTTAQIVISIYNRAVRIIRAFGWSEEERDFVEVPIKYPPS
jgi:proteasome lid subunit RPN8/RPN11